MSPCRIYFRVEGHLPVRRHSLFAEHIGKHPALVCQAPGLGSLWEECETMRDLLLAGCRQRHHLWPFVSGVSHLNLCFLHTWLSTPMYPAQTALLKARPHYTTQLNSLCRQSSLVGVSPRVWHRSTTRFPQQLS